MDNFDLKKYLAEGKLFEENQSPKFKIGDLVQPKVGSTVYLLDRDRGTIKDKKKYIGQIQNVQVNKPKNLRTKDGEYLYTVTKLNHRGRDVMSFDFKESDLESTPNSTDLAEGKLNEQLDLSSREYSAKKLFALIARDLEFSSRVQDDEMLDADEALEIMRKVIEIEGTESSPEAALGEYIANGEL